jgi:hypothetical protein
MTVTFTSIIRIRDWRRLGEIDHTALRRRSQQAGAQGVQVLRDIHDPSQALVIAELPDQDAVCDWRMALEEHLAPALAEVHLDARAWETTGVLDLPAMRTAEKPPPSQA